MNRIFTALTLVISSVGIAQTEVYYEDFQTGLPLTYTIVDIDGLTPDPAVSDFANAWIELTDPDNVNDTVVGSTSFFSPVGQADRWLITPPITLGAYGNILSWEAKSHDASYLDGYHIYISITNTDLSSFIDTLGIVNFENSTWTSRELNLSEAGYNNQTVHIAFVNRTDDGFKLYLDDIRMVIEDPVGISENKLSSVAVYPNPSNGILNIVGDNVSSVKVFDSMGQLIIEGTDKSFDLSDIETGIYLVSVVDNGIAKTFRWIKQ